MKQHTADEIKSKVRELWGREWFYDDDCKHPRVEPPEVEVESTPSFVKIRLERMYDPPGLTFQQLKALSEYFETDNINDDSFGWGGCETCDYGSRYGFTLTVRP